MLGLGLAGQMEAARAALAAMRHPSRLSTFHAWTNHLDAWLHRRIPEMVATLEPFSTLKIQDDPEAIFQEGWLFCDAGDDARGFER
ncbi:MAG: hypothetical protein AB7I50_11360 [Vicinamibacterales bacterium]